MMVLGRSLRRFVLGLSLVGVVVAPVASAAAISPSHEIQAVPGLNPSATPVDRLSIDDGKSWIAVEKFSFGNGRTTHRPVEVTVPIDASTASFTAALEKNPSLPSVRMSIHSADYAFRNVVFSKISDSPGASGKPVRQFTFIYQTVTYTITPGGKSATDDWSQ